MSSVSGESDVHVDNSDTPNIGNSKEEDGDVESVDLPAEVAGNDDLDVPEIAKVNEEDESESLADNTTNDERNGTQKESNYTEPLDSVLQPASAFTNVASADESLSIPDDTPSVQGSILSSPGSSAPGSRPHQSRRYPSGALHPFERRFSSRLSPSPVQSPRNLSPAFLSNHSRQSSISSQIFQSQDESETPQAPWEVVRWTKLKKFTGQVFSEIGKRNFGRATCLCVGASIVVGTSKGFVLVFDYHQVLKSIVGPGTKAIECGAVTSLAISADHSTVAAGYMNGNIFTWEFSRPAKPFLHIVPLDRATLENRRLDGHVSGVAILHIGFLGTRHTALVSADSGGMAFSHLATRGLGAVGRTVKTTRILGRYPMVGTSLERPRKASSVLAFAPLPLGNVEQPTDGLGLTAFLTPYLLVIVSTTPIAQTQHKTGRPKELAPHSTLSGCLAWFPAVKLKSSNANGENALSQTKLVYCWSNILTILVVETPGTYENDKPPELHFRPRSRWRSDEAIVAVQWLSRSVLAVLTISQRLIILEDTSSLRMTDSFDLLQKHIYHQDLFSKQLLPVVEQLDESDQSMDGVVADAFYMSFRAYKGRLFLLGFNDISIGTLSNWADRLLALMENGDFIAAINLATSFYNGDTDKLTVGLPEDDAARHAIVKEKLVEMISASLRYIFSRGQGASEGDEKHQQLTELAAACFTACLSLENLDILFEDVYEAFEQDGSESRYFETLEPYIMDGEITIIPPVVLKDMITFYASLSRTGRLEEMICKLDTLTMDIDLVTTLCRQYSLYDALIYVWNKALNDYITPLVDLLTLVKVLNHDDQNSGDTDSQLWESAMKVFPYLAFALTGRVYPNGAPLEDEEANKAKYDLYSFIFAGKVTEWPKGSAQVFTTQTSGNVEPNFPYLRLLLYFDTSNFMSLLNETFEDTYLNGDHAPPANGSLNGKRRQSSLTPTRQYIVNILLGVVSTDEFEAEDVVYFYMFLARNLPKFPQYLMLPGSTLHRILVGLCEYPSEELKDDCQLSVEYLLSVYHPSDVESLVPLLHRAGFFRVLKSIYSSTKQYPKLLETFFRESEDQEGVFDCIGDCLRPNLGLAKKQLQDIHRVITDHALDLARLSAIKTATTIKAYAPELLESVVEAAQDDSDAQYGVLRALIQPENERGREKRTLVTGQPPGFIERYVQLMCRFNPSHVSEFVSFLQSGDLKLDSIMPALEKSGIVDAAVILLARDGLVERAMQRLVEHLGTLQTALVGLIKAAADSPDAANTEEAVQDLLEAAEKYIKVGIWLCQGQTITAESQPASRKARIKSFDEQTEEDLEPFELLWLNLVDTVVEMTRTVTTTLNEPDVDSSSTPGLDSQYITSTLRSAVQNLFTSLLASTTSKFQATSSNRTTTSTSKRAKPAMSQSFLVILRAFLTRASHSSPSLSDLRQVLADVFSAYTFEETILSLATRFLDKDTFVHVADLYEKQQQGWRPRGQVCEGCKRRVFGPGVGAGVWEAWECKEEIDEKRRMRRMVELGGGEEAMRLKRGKGKAESVAATSTPESDVGEQPATGLNTDGTEEDDTSSTPAVATQQQELGPIVVFACRHIFHRRCLEKAQPQRRPGSAEEMIGTNLASRYRARQFRCPLAH